MKKTKKKKKDTEKKEVQNGRFLQAGCVNFNSPPFSLSLFLRLTLPGGRRTKAGWHWFG